VLFLLRAPQPRRATRWGWFWVFSIPLGLGILWWLLDEHPWSLPGVGAAGAVAATGAAQAARR
jgi:hypothetical protein